LFVNGADPAGSDRLYATSALDKFPMEHRLGLVMEGMIRAIRTLAPNATHIQVLASCSRCLRENGTKSVKMTSMQRILQFHRVETVDLAHACLEHQFCLWRSGKQDVHPVWQTHQAIADVVAYAVRKHNCTLSAGVPTFSGGCSFECVLGGQSSQVARPVTAGAVAAAGPTTEGTASHGASQGTLYPKEELRLVQACMSPTSEYSAYEAGLSTDTGAGDKQTHAADVTGDWSFFEDISGKPGWIANQPGQQQHFRLRFGLVPALAVTYLRSYEGMGSAILTLNNMTAPTLHGHWDEKTSVSQTIWYHVGHSVQQTRNLEFGMFGFNISPHTEHIATFTFVGTDRSAAEGGPAKFKLIALAAC